MPKVWAYPAKGILETHFFSLQLIKIRTKTFSAKAEAPAPLWQAGRRHRRLRAPHAPGRRATAGFQISGQCRFAGAALPCTCCVTAGAFCAACLRCLSVLPASAEHQRCRPAPVARLAAFAWCDRVLRQSADRHDRHDRHDRLDLCWQHDAKTESSSRRSQRGHPEAWQGRGAGQAARRPDFP